jgi:alanine racemase
MSRPTTITIHLDALRHNLQQIRALAPNSRVLAMVKSNAYGHGIERIALALPDADALGVACIEEGMILRQAGVTNPIVLMEGLFAESELALAEKEDFTLVVHHADQISMLEKNPQLKPLSIWLKIDTGMHRLGFAAHEVQMMYSRLLSCPAVKKPIGCMTHFAKADVRAGMATQQQIAVFNSVTSELPGPKSLANSAGILAWPAVHNDWVRPGIMLYGASPFAGECGVQHGLKPVMALSSQLIAIHHIKAGAEVGYGGHWTAPEDMVMGIVGAGYGDGYPRHAKNGTPILVNGVACQLIGRVAMDMLTVDLRNVPEAKVGDPVMLWGPSLPVEVIAECSETLGYELLTRITQRVHVVVDDPIANQYNAQSSVVAETIVS